jgi:hypothetical protein
MTFLTTSCLYIFFFLKVYSISKENESFKLFLRNNKKKIIFIHFLGTRRALKDFLRYRSTIKIKYILKYSKEKSSFYD